MKSQQMFEYFQREFDFGKDEVRLEKVHVGDLLYAVG